MPEGRQVKTWRISDCRRVEVLFFTPPRPFGTYKYTSNFALGGQHWRVHTLCNQNRISILESGVVLRKTAESRRTCWPILVPRLSSFGTSLPGGQPASSERICLTAMQNTSRSARLKSRRLFRTDEVRRTSFLCKGPSQGRLPKSNRSNGHTAKA